MKKGDQFHLKYTDGWDELLVLSDYLEPFDPAADDDEFESLEAPNVFVLCLRLAAATEDGVFSADDVMHPGALVLFQRDQLLDMLEGGQPNP